MSPAPEPGDAGVTLLTERLGYGEHHGPYSQDRGWMPAYLRSVDLSAEPLPPLMTAIDRVKFDRDLWRARHAIAAADANREARWRWRITRFLRWRLLRFSLGIVVGFAMGLATG